MLSESAYLLAAEYAPSHTLADGVLVALGFLMVLTFMTLIMMGAATALIGLLPTYAQIGVAAPILLIVLRVVQGFSAGGEWGGAALMAVEHAPLGKRGYFGSYPQTGVPLEMLREMNTDLLTLPSGFTMHRKL